MSFMLQKRTLIVLLVLCVCGVAQMGCGPKFDEMSPREIFEYGSEKYQKEKFSDSIEAYEKLIDLYPFSMYVTQAELQIADSYFHRRRFIEAATAYEDFIDRHPTNESTPHAMHYLGISHYKLKRAIDRDQEETYLAQDALSRLSTQYPNYSKIGDAKEKLIEVRSDLAKRERYIGRFYLREKEYYAALVRYQRIVRLYADTEYYPEALYFCALCYLKLEENREAQRYIHLVKTKFPNHKYSEKAEDLIDEQDKAQ
jgi:outer membrane protein assembly factor BamD